MATTAMLLGFILAAPSVTSASPLPPVVDTNSDTCTGSTCPVDDDVNLLQTGVTARKHKRSQPSMKNELVFLRTLLAKIEQKQPADVVRFIKAQAHRQAARKRAGPRDVDSVSMAPRLFALGSGSGSGSGEGDFELDTSMTCKATDCDMFHEEGNKYCYCDCWCSGYGDCCSDFNEKTCCDDAPKPTMPPMPPTMPPMPPTMPPLGSGSGPMPPTMPPLGSGSGFGSGEAWGDYSWDSELDTSMSCKPTDKCKIHEEGNKYCYCDCWCSGYGDCCSNFDQTTCSSSCA